MTSGKNFKSYSNISIIHKLTRWITFQGEMLRYKGYPVGRQWKFGKLSYEHFESSWPAHSKKEYC